MSSVRVHKLEKYDEIIVNDTLIEDTINCSDIPNSYIVGIDFSVDANIFYGFRDGDKKYKRINFQDFSNCDVVLRLINWSREAHRENYTFRVLKSNKSDAVDIEKEKEYLGSFLDVSSNIYKNIELLD